MLLQPLLVLALELVLEDDATDVRALLAKPLLVAQVGAIELGVVRQLARPADAGVERLLARRRRGRGGGLPAGGGRVP